MKGMITCSVCSRDLPLIIEEHYIARDTKKTGVVPALTGEQESGLYDAIDCPHCGCQIILQSRKREECPCDYGICDECGVEEDEEEEDQEDE